MRGPQMRAVASSAAASCGSADVPSPRATLSLGQKMAGTGSNGGKITV
jgi:hypothetical protein